MLTGIDDEAGFSTRNCQRLVESFAFTHLKLMVVTYRNQNLLNRGFTSQKAKKSGTTIVGVSYADGIILASDSKSAGHVIFDHAIPKIYRVQDNV